jgi:hypothetical protein
MQRRLAMTDFGGADLRMGVNFPLAEFERRIAADADVLGMLYVGSLGRGAADRCSDIDVALWLTDEALQRPGALAHYMGYLGELHFVFAEGAEGLSGNGYAGPDWQSIDVALLRKDFEPDPYWSQARVMKDTDGYLAALVASSPPPKPEVTRESARKVIEETIHILSHITMHAVRGSYHQAMGNLVEQLTNIYGLLARLRGCEAYDVRVVERFLAPEELALMYAAWPAGPERAEIRRATHGLWDWTRYVWAEAEQTLGESLGLTLDSEALLAALEDRYTWAQS